MVRFLSFPDLMIRSFCQSVIIKYFVIDSYLMEKRENKGLLFRNLILGGQDGLVNVLGIVLGVAIATKTTNLVLLSGLAATVAESVSMAAVAYTSTRAETEHYESEKKRQALEIVSKPDEKKEDIRQVYKQKGFEKDLLEKVVNKIFANKKILLNSLMQDKLNLNDPAEDMTPFWQGVIVGLSAVVGSIIPLIPFLFLSVTDSMVVALILSLIVLFAFGAYKSSLTSGKWAAGGFELMLIGGTAALAGFLVGALFQVPV